jgi:hypothetical protein
VSQEVKPSTHHTALALHLLWLTPLIIMSLLIAACNSLSDRVFDRRMSSGIIEYRISFPDVKDESITASLLPEKMTYTFTEHAFVSTFETVGGVFKNRIMANRLQKTLDQELKVFRKKIRVEMNENEILSMLTKYPKMMVVHTDDVDTIAGFPCQKALLIFENVEEPEIEVYYTNHIKMNQPNWCTQYHDIEGVLMAFEVVEFGIRMRLEATQVMPSAADPSFFERSLDYTVITRDRMDVEMEELVATFEL